MYTRCKKESFEIHVSCRKLKALFKQYSLVIQCTSCFCFNTGGFLPFLDSMDKNYPQSNHQIQGGKQRRSGLLQPFDRRAAGERRPALCDHIPLGPSPESSGGHRGLEQ